MTYANIDIDQEIPILNMSVPQSPHLVCSSLPNIDCKEWGPNLFNPGQPSVANSAKSLLIITIRKS